MKKFLITVYSIVFLGVSPIIKTTESATSASNTLIITTTMEDDAANASNALFLEINSKILEKHKAIASSRIDEKNNYIVAVHPSLMIALAGKNQPKNAEQFVAESNIMLNTYNEAYNYDYIDAGQKAECEELMVDTLNSDNVEGIYQHELGHLYSGHHEERLELRTKRKEGLITKHEVHREFRRQEFEADAFAVNESQESAIGLLDYMKKLCHLDKKTNLSSSYTSHPGPCLRLEHIKQHIERLYGKQL